jgi:hypothetical protein
MKGTDNIEDIQKLKDETQKLLTYLGNRHSDLKKELKGERDKDKKLEIRSDLEYTRNTLKDIGKRIKSHSRALEQMRGARKGISLPTLTVDKLMEQAAMLKKFRDASHELAAEEEKNLEQATSSKERADHRFMAEHTKITAHKMSAAIHEVETHLKLRELDESMPMPNSTFIVELRPLVLDAMESAGKPVFSKSIAALRRTLDRHAKSMGHDNIPLKRAHEISQRVSELHKMKRQTQRMNKKLVKMAGE